MPTQIGPKQVFLVSDTRTGSTALSDALAKAFGGFSLGEIFYAGPKGAIGLSLREQVLATFCEIQVQWDFVAKLMYHDLLLAQEGKFRLGGCPILLRQLESLFPGAVILHLTRKDFVGAAYSELRAVELQEFHLRTDAQASSTYGGTFSANKDEIMLLAQERKRSLEIARVLISGCSLPIVEIDYEEIFNSSSRSIKELMLNLYGAEIELLFEHEKIVTRDENQVLDMLRRELDELNFN